MWGKIKASLHSHLLVAILAGAASGLFAHFGVPAPVATLFVRLIETLDAPAPELVQPAPKGFTTDQSARRPE